MPSEYQPFITPTKRIESELDVPDDPKFRWLISGYIRQKVLLKSIIFPQEIIQIVYVFGITPKQYQAKLVIIGQSNVGKTAILFQLLDKEYNQKNVNEHVYYFNPFLDHKAIKINNYVSLELEIWDNWNHSPTHSWILIKPMMFLRSGAILIVYDVNDINSFQTAKNMVNELKNKMIKLQQDPTNEFNHNTLVFLIGNKIDLAGSHRNYGVSTEEGQEFAKKNDLYFLEVSAKNSSQIDQLFELIAYKITKYKIFLSRNITNKENKDELATKTNFKSCVVL